MGSGRKFTQNSLSVETHTHTHTHTHHTHHDGIHAQTRCGIIFMNHVCNTTNKFLFLCSHNCFAGVSENDRGALFAFSSRSNKRQETMVKRLRHFYDSVGVSFYDRFGFLPSKKEGQMGEGDVGHSFPFLAILPNSKLRSPVISCKFGSVHWFRWRHTLYCCWYRVDP